MDILDDNWNDVLYEHIPKMLTSMDKQCYELTIASLCSKLQDAHVMFYDTDFLDNEFGFYSAPVYLTVAESQIVVGRVHSNYEDTCKLLPGDVLLEINGINMDEVIMHCKKYLSVPNDDKLLNAIGHYLLRSHDRIIEITILRNESNIKIDVQCEKGIFHASRFIDPDESHRLLEENIGLINPSRCSDADIHEIMEEFKDTKGLIIDLRQYPAGSSIYLLEEYFVHSRLPFATISYPSIAVPGVFVDAESMYSGNTLGEVIYEKPVVLLMDQTTQSAGEFLIMKLCVDSNVTVIGQNSIGADGNITFLPLPGGNTLTFTSLGVYTTEGGQTQRIGIPPNIYVERTVEGVRDKKDELMEAAIEHILCISPSAYVHSPLRNR